MMNNLINAKVILKLSDPWDLGEMLGWQGLDAIICDVKKKDNRLTLLAIKLAKPFDYKNTHCEYFIASPRLEDDFNKLQNNEAVFCGLTRVPFDQIISNDPFDLSGWRGGIGLIGEIEINQLNGAKPGRYSVRRQQ